MNRRILLFSASVIGLSAISHASTEKPDSISDLEEIVVEGRSEIVSPSKTVYRPSGRTKNASQNAYDLLNRMAIPQIRTNPMSPTDIKTSVGNDVSIFINYVLASTEELSGMNTRDVRSVEYLDFPTDPRFRGVDHAINIIVQEYEYGGYTKISDRQFLDKDFSNQGNIFSKMSYKKMTYDLYVGSDIVRSKHVGSSSEETFHLPIGDVNRSQERISSDFGYNNFPLTFRASYNTEKIQIRNTIGFSDMNRMKATIRSRLTFNAPAVLGLDNEDYLATSDTPYHTTSLSWNGNYYFALPKNWSIGAYPSFAYSRNRSNSSYVTNVPGQTPIINNAGEDSYTAGISVNTMKKVGEKHTFKLDADVSEHVNHINYSGSSGDQRSNFTSTWFSISPAYSLSIDKLQINADAGICGEFKRTNGEKYDDWYPFAHLSVNWVPNQENNLGFWLQYATNSPEASMRTPNILQTSEFLYRTGDPLLHDSRHFTAAINYTWFPSQIFYMGANVNYFGEYDRAVTVYEPYKNGYALLTTYRNSGDINQLTVFLYGVLRLLNGNLVFTAQPKLDHIHSSGYINDSATPFTFQFQGTYYFGDFNLQAYYGTKSTSFNGYNGTRTHTPDTLYIAFGWANANWNLAFSASNFHRYRYDANWSECEVPYYSSRRFSFNGNYHASFCLSATYTFGYGKKIQHRNEIGVQKGSQSAIMQ